MRSYQKKQAFVLSSIVWTAKLRAFLSDFSVTLSNSALPFCWQVLKTFLYRGPQEVSKFWLPNLGFQGDSSHIWDHRDPSLARLMKFSPIWFLLQPISCAKFVHVAEWKACQWGRRLWKSVSWYHQWVKYLRCKLPLLCPCSLFPDKSGSYSKGGSNNTANNIADLRTSLFPCGTVAGKMFTIVECERIPFFWKMISCNPQSFSMGRALFVITSFQLSAAKKVFYVCLYDCRVFFLLSLLL